MHNNTISLVRIVCFILLIPLFGNLFIDGWNWGVGDFVFAFLMLFCTGSLIQFARRRVTNSVARAAVVAVIVLIFLVIWIELATDGISRALLATKNWNTYSSQKYNFEFKYPVEATLSDQSEGYVSVSFMGEKQKASGRTQTELFDGYAFNVARTAGSGYRDLDDFYTKKVQQLKDICSEIGDPKETTISGKRAITQSMSCFNDYEVSYALNNNMYFEMSLLYVGDEEDIPRYKDRVQQIFSTFRFTQ